MGKTQTFNASRAVSDAITRAKRALELQKEHSALLSKAEKVSIQLEKFLSGNSKKSASGKKQGRPAADSSTKRSRGGSPDGRSLSEVIVQDVLQSGDSEAMARPAILAGVIKSGYQFSEGSKPINSINQALTNLKRRGLALVPERGRYTLSKSDEKASESQEEAVESQEAVIAE